MTGDIFPTRRNLHLLLEPPSPPRPTRLEVRIAAADGHSPIGRSRSFRITEDSLRQLIDHALRLEARR